MDSFLFSGFNQFSHFLNYWSLTSKAITKNKPKIMLLKSQQSQFCHSDNTEFIIKNSYILRCHSSALLLNQSSFTKIISQLIVPLKFFTFLIWWHFGQAWFDEDGSGGVDYKELIIGLELLKDDSIENKMKSKRFLNIV